MLTIRVEGTPGDTISETSKEMSRIAKLLNIAVECKFNDIEVYTFPNSSEHYAADMYFAEIKRERKKKETR